MGRLTLRRSEEQLGVANREASSQSITSQLVDDVFEWDIACWKGALSFWEPFLRGLKTGSVLEVGARNGGLSLYFAQRGFHVTCSDVNGPSELASQVHGKYCLENRVTYSSIDAVDIESEDASFDLVCFKSVLGSIGSNGRRDRQKKAVEEMCRVLKPGGRLLFAENLKASPLHAYFRKRFVPWGKSYGYLSLDELKNLLCIFKSVDLKPHGLLSVFGRSERQRSILHQIDATLDLLYPVSFKYVVFGRATK